MKQMDIVVNSAGGFDLMVEKDSGNPVRILTGNKSYEFFDELETLCQTAKRNLNWDAAGELPIAAEELPFN